MMLRGNENISSELMDFDMKLLLPKMKFSVAAIAEGQ